MPKQTHYHWFMFLIDGFLVVANSVVIASGEYDWWNVAFAIFFSVTVLWHAFNLLFRSD